MNIEKIKCPSCNEIIYLDKIETVTIYGSNWESTHHSCYKCNKNLVIVLKTGKTHIGSFDENDHFYEYKNIELKVFDCVSKKYILSKGYKFDIDGGLHAIEY